MPLFLALLWSTTTQDPVLRKRAFAGLKRYQQAPRHQESEPRQVVAEHGRARLLTRERYGKAEKSGAPIVIVPSLINPPDVLDLTPRRSLLRYLLREGHDAYLLDWGEPDAGDRGVGSRRPHRGAAPPDIGAFLPSAGADRYCLGGTLAIGAAARLAANGTPARALATIAAPWDFAQYDAAFRAQIDTVWTQSRPSCEALGLVPMEVLQAGFWSLDPARTIGKYADFLELDEDSLAYRGFITLEDWANEGAPLTLACGRDLMEGCYGANLPGTGAWSVGGTRIDPSALACPTSPSPRPPRPATPSSPPRPRPRPTPASTSTWAMSA